MKVRNDFLFGHPVLRPEANDYVEGAFDAQFMPVLRDEAVELRYELRLQNEDLRQLVGRGDAGLGFFIVNQPTFLNRLVECTSASGIEELRSGNLFGTVSLRPVVWAKKARRDWKHSSLHEEYGGITSFPAASLLAFGVEHRFTVDREQLRPMESIFLLASDPDVRPGEIRVDPEGAKIRIIVAPATKQSIEGFRGTDAGRNVLLGSVYLPAVMELLDQVRGEQGRFSEYSWFRVLEAKCVKHSISLDNASLLDAAQRLLQDPFVRIDALKDELAP